MQAKEKDGPAGRLAGGLGQILCTYRGEQGQLGKGGSD